MKTKSLIFCIIALLLLSTAAFAADTLTPPEAADIQAAQSAVDSPADVNKPAVILQSGGLLVTSPMETGAVGFWFPGDGSFAAGIAHTILRASHSSVPKLTLDVDATIAQEVNQTKDTLGGIGFKLGYNVIPPSQVGFSFAPSIGLTALNDFETFHTIGDILTHYRIAVYGTVLLYKW
ncbi:MAG: hypothetical protein P8Z70_11100 [Desulfuromonadales bacterium]|jgi:hypothetical protein